MELPGDDDWMRLPTDTIQTNKATNGKSSGTWRYKWVEQEKTMKRAMNLSETWKVNQQITVKENGERRVFKGLILSKITEKKLKS